MVRKLTGRQKERNAEMYVYCSMVSTEKEFLKPCLVWSFGKKFKCYNKNIIHFLHNNSRGILLLFIFPLFHLEI